MLLIMHKLLVVAWTYSRIVCATLHTTLCTFNKNMKYTSMIFVLLHFWFFGVLSKEFDYYYDVIWPISKEFHLKQINLTMI